MNTLITFFKNDFFIPFIVIVFAAFIFSIFCELIIYSSINFYFWIQELLIINSSRSNKHILGKLIIIVYKFHKIIVSFFVQIKPFQFKKIDSYQHFQPKLCTTKSKNNIIIILICLGFSVIINFILNHANSLNEIYIWLVNKQIDTNILNYMSENKWIMVSSFGVLFLVYEVLKDRFTNKIILEIQDEELKNIFITHKELYKDFITLRNTLCYNISHFFDTPKNNGIIYSVHKSITKKFPSFTYNISHQSFIKEECQSLYYSLNAPNYGYKNITDITRKMKKRIEEFKNTNPFYNTSAINKYLRGLQGFDISSAINDNDEGNLLCEEFMKSLHEQYPKHTTNFITNSKFDNTSKITELNEILHNNNSRAISTALKTIEYAIDIDTYTYKFNKAFALKTRRKNLSFAEIAKKYK